MIPTVDHISPKIADERGKPQGIRCGYHKKGVLVGDPSNIVKECTRVRQVFNDVACHDNVDPIEPYVSAIERCGIGANQVVEDARLSKSVDRFTIGIDADAVLGQSR
jgi:hypothetical protein